MAGVGIVRDADRSDRRRSGGLGRNMQPLGLLGESTTPDGSDLKLTRRTNEYIILANGKSLMSSRMHGSEEALATFACHDLRAAKHPCILIGGLGMGFTLRAALDLLPRE